jgi:Flp pilus assembly pilin Flp
MSKFKKKLSIFNSDRGATSIEYGLVAALIGTVLISSLQGLGGAMTGAFSRIGTAAGQADAGGNADANGGGGSDNGADDSGDGGAGAGAGGSGSSGDNGRQEYRW